MTCPQITAAEILSEPTGVRGHKNMARLQRFILIELSFPISRFFKDYWI